MKEDVEEDGWLDNSLVKIISVIDVRSLVGVRKKCFASQSFLLEYIFCRGMAFVHGLKLELSSAASSAERGQIHNFQSNFSHSNAVEISHSDNL